MKESRFSSAPHDKLLGADGDYANICAIDTFNFWIVNSPKFTSLRLSGFSKTIRQIVLYHFSSEIQLISEDVQLVIPLPELRRWSFYTLKHYVSQYNCDSSSDLSLRCILGDEVDGVPRIQTVVPNFGRNTTVKLLKKHGFVENLLSAAAVRTVGKQYVQEALTKQADHLLKNYKVLSLRSNIDVNLEDAWLCERDTSNYLNAIFEMRELLVEVVKRKHEWIPRSCGR